MGFIDKVTETLTGRSKEERAIEKETVAKIRKRANEEYLKAKEIESIVYAKERAKVEREAAVRKLRSRASTSGMLSYWGSSQPKKYSSPFGYAGVSSIIRGSVQRRGRIRRKPKKSRRVVYTESYQPYRVI